MVWTDNSDDTTDGAREGLSMARDDDADYLFGASAIGFKAAEASDWFTGEPKDVEDALNKLAPGVGWIGKANTWSADQLMSGSNELQFNSSSNSISGGAITLSLDGAVSVLMKTSGTVRGTFNNSGLDVPLLVRARGFRSDADPGGAAGTNTSTNQNTTPSGVQTTLSGRIGGKGEPVNAQVARWVKMYVGTGVFYLSAYQ